LVVTIGVLCFQSLMDERRKLRAQYNPAVRSAAAKMELGRLTTRIGTERTQRMDPLGIFVADELSPFGHSDSPDPVTEAERELSEIIAGLPKEPDAYYHRARARFLLGRIDEAHADLDEALSADEGFAPARILEASILRVRGRRTAADRALDPAIQSGSRWARALASAHEAVMELRWSDAATEYTTAIEEQIHQPEVYAGAWAEMHLQRRLALIRAQEYRAAIEDFVIARDRWPEALLPALLTAEAYCHDDATEEAERVLSRFHDQARVPPLRR